MPLSGVDDDVASLTAALRANGIAVSCLGGDPTWTVDHDAALNWAFRATTDAVFDGVHLDVEPWALPRWPTATGHAILADVRGIAELCESAGARYRIGVETQPPPRRYRQHDVRRRRRG